MIRRLALATAALGLLAGPAVLADEPKDTTKGEAELAKMIEGRIAGEPSSCINTFGSRSLTQIDGTALVYRSGDTIWVNYTRTPDAIDEDEILVIRKFSGSQLCRSDQITLRDRFSYIFSGFLILDDFVPYRLPEGEG